MPSPGPSPTTTILMRRLERLSAATPAELLLRQSGRDGNTFVDQLKVMLQPGRGTTSRPSSRPLLRAVAFLLRHWLAPYAVLMLPLLVRNQGIDPGAAWCHSLGLTAVVALWLSALMHCLYFDWQLRRSLWDAGAVAPGVYVGPGARASQIGERLRALQDSHRPTRWVWNGDMQTLVPYITYPSPHVAFTRLWFKAPAVGNRGRVEENAGGAPACKTAPTRSMPEYEVLAHDWALPDGGHDPSKPLAVVLHGLNGGSAEPLVMDFVAAATRRGWTCVVLNARGLGGTELSSAHPFHGARTSDLAALLALTQEAAPGVRLVGVGFSMGAVVLANYVGVAGASCRLSAAVAISGCIDAIANKGGYGSRSFEAFLTGELKNNFCTGPRAAHLARGGVDLSAAIGPRVDCIMEFDAATVVPFNAFNDVDDYYRHMSLGHLGKERRVTVPLLHVHACDDPIIDCDTFAPYLRGGTPPPNLHFLITRRGGHVGWCEGWLPWRTRWGFQNRAVFAFVDAVVEEQQEAATKPSRRRPDRSPARHRGPSM